VNDKNKTMAFKMNPKSPLLMKAMGYASPAKQRSGGTDMARDISEEMEPAQELKMKKELRRVKKKKPSTIEAEDVKVEDTKKGIVNTLPKNNENNKAEGAEKQLTAKQKALKALKDAQEDNEVSNIEKETSKVKKNSTKKRKQAKRKDSQAERRTEKTKRLEERIERRKKRRSPAKQTAKQKANLPKEVVNAIAAKSPAKEIDKAGQRIIRQGEKAKAAYKAGDTKKGDRHKVRAKRMNGRYNAKMLKNNLKAGRNEISEFEKNIEIQEKFDAKIEKAKGNTKKIARLTKRANSKMDRSAN
jgi:hypothetical protein